MASDRSYLEFVLEQLGELDGVTWRAMMGEFILYYNGKVVGGIYDNRLLVKPTPSARRLLPNAPMEQPYAGAKAMLLVDEIDDRALLCRLLREMEGELPAKKEKRK